MCILLFVFTLVMHFIVVQTFFYIFLFVQYLQVLW